MEIGKLWKALALGAGIVGGAVGCEDTNNEERAEETVERAREAEIDRRGYGPLEQAIQGEEAERAGELIQDVRQMPPSPPYRPGEIVTRRPYDTEN